jgi:AbiV family abortive infection protein
VSSKRLTPEQVHKVGVAALNNAASHVVAAGILIEYGRPRSAYGIGVTGVEELAKFFLCRQRLRRWQVPPTVKELNAELRPAPSAHLPRYEMVLTYMSGFGTPLPPGHSSVHEMAVEDIKARDRVLYVEIAPTGEPMSPEGVDEDHARMWVAGMRDFFFDPGEGLARRYRRCPRGRA